MHPGQIVADRFEVQELAGAGGMGTVYRARDRQSGATVALKILHGREAHHARRFSREARVLAQLSHPGVVRYIAHGGASEGGMYLAMEWLEGGSLGQRLKRGRLGVEETIALATRVADALSAAHRRGIVHRDVKPSNLFLRGGRLDGVVIVDFGVAHLAHSASAARHGGHELTLTGVPIGTPGYMAPEQVRGQRDIDARADVFALGSVMYRCLTGKGAFDGDDVFAAMLKIVLEDPPGLAELCPGVPAALDDLVMRMLEKARSDRPETCEVVLRELAAVSTAAPAPPSVAARQRIGSTERRTVCLLVARPEDPSDPDASTLVTSDVEALRRALRALAERHGGKLDFLQEGALLVTLAGDEALTDQAARAARCALAMRELLPDYPMALAAWRGVPSGRVPVGEVIDRAVRLLTRERGEVVRLDEVTAGLLDARFEVGNDALGLYLSSERDPGEARRTLLGKPTECVGRDREISVLTGTFEQCASESAARAVVVTGAPGIGKSRLRYEVLRKLEKRRDAPTVWIARGDPMTAGSPFGLLAQALRRAAGVLDGEAIGQSRRKLRSRVTRHTDAASADRITEFIGEMAGVPFPDEASDLLRSARHDALLMGDQMLRAWTDLVAAECGARTVLLVLEDLHWGDLPTVRFVDAALRNLGDRPFMALALGRRDLEQQFPNLWSGRPVTHLHLGALTRKASEKLVRQVLGEVGDDTVSRLVERAGGNVFYLEELIRAAADRAIRRSGAGSGAGSPTLLDVEELPETVAAMVEARLAGLDPEVRRILRAGSVFGQAFWRGGVAALLGETSATAELDGRLAELGRRELVERRPQSKFPANAPRTERAPDTVRTPPTAADAEEYMFRHALVRDTAYAMLIDSDRILGHQLAGEWLEQAGERDPLLLAEHFERGDVPTRAAVWYARAAEQALEGNDLEAAIARAARGIACAAGARRAGPASEPPPSLRTERTVGAAPPSRRSDAAPGDLIGALHLVQAEAHQWRGENAAAESSGIAAMHALSRSSPKWYAASGEVAAASSRRGNLESLSSVGEALSAFWPAPEMVAAHVMASARVAVHLLHAGNPALGVTLLTRIEEQVPDFDKLAVAARAWALRGRASRALFEGDPGAYHGLVERAAATFEETGDLRSSCVQRVNLGFASIELGRFGEAEQALRGAIVQADRMGLYNTVSVARHNLGIALAHAGALDEALAVESEATEAFRLQGDRRMEGGSRIYLATILSLRGDHAGAEREAALAVEVLAPSPPGRAHALAELARVRLERGAGALALPAAREAMQLLESLGGLEEGESLVRLAYAEALEANGEHIAARAAIRLARERLLARAERIRDDASRRSFLERVPENARTVALASAWEQ